MLTEEEMRIREMVDFELWKAELYRAFHRGEMRGEGVMAIIDELAVIGASTENPDLRGDTVNLLRDFVLAGYPGLESASGVS